MDYFFYLGNLTKIKTYKKIKLFLKKYVCNSKDLIYKILKSFPL